MTTTTDLDTADPGAGGPLPDRIAFARALADAHLLPAALRKRPADVLLVVEYGRELGLAPVAATQTLAVIDGKVTIPAALAATLARRAGHRLRIDSQPDRATATLVRHDDPGYAFTATWDLARAQAAGLAGRGAWRTYPQQMLVARAITEAVRMGAPEVLVGSYAVEELTDAPAWSAPVEAVEDRPALEDLRALADALTAAGHRDPDAQRGEVARILDRPVASAADLTAADVTRVRDHLAAAATGRLAAAGITVADPTAPRPDRWDHAHPEATRADLRPTERQAGMVRGLAARLVLADEDLEEVAAASGVVRPMPEWTRADASKVIDALIARERAEYPRKADRADRSDPGPWEVPADDTAAAAYLEAVTAAWQDPDADGRPGGPR